MKCAKTTGGRWLWLFIWGLGVIGGGCAAHLSPDEAQRVSRLADSVRTRDSLRAMHYLDSLRIVRDSLQRLPISTEKP